MKEIHDSHYKKFVAENRLIIWGIVEPPSGECTDIRHSVFFEGEHHKDALVARVWSGGYWIVSAWISPSVSKDVLVRLFYKTALKVRYLNGDSSVDLAWGYLNALCKDFIDDGDIMYNREKLYEVVEDAYAVEMDVNCIKELRKWQWIGMFAFLKSSVKSSIRMTHRNMTETERTYRSIEDAIATLSNEKRFITVSLISSMVGISEEGVRRYMNLFREEIDSINISNFDTSNFHSYVRDENVSNIIMAIKELYSVNKRLSKTDVADITDLSRMTIHRLWEDERVQRAMNEYNKTMTA